MTWLVVALTLWCQAYHPGATWDDTKLQCVFPDYEQSYH